MFGNSFVFSGIVFIFYVTDTEIIWEEVDDEIRLEFCFHLVDRFDPVHYVEGVVASGWFDIIQVHLYYIV